MAVVIRAVTSGCRFGLRVKPGARRHRLVGAHGDRLKLEVSAPPERGKANVAVEKLLAEALGLKQHQVKIVAGATSQDKQVELTGVDAMVIAARFGVVGIETTVFD